MRADLGERRMEEESMWKAVVLIPKVKGGCRVISLMEVVWKLVTAILNRQLTDSIIYHTFLHIFRAGCGTGIATLEVKFIRKLAVIREEFLYMIFLYLHKLYDSLDSDRCLVIVEGYSVGPQA